MTHYVPKVIQLMLIEQFNCDMKHSSHPIKLSTEGPVNDKEYTLFSDHVAKTTDTKPAHINTWKRVFEKLVNKETGQPFKPSATTYNTIAKFLGCESWNDLEANKDNLKPQQRRVFAQIVFNKEDNTSMNHGDILEIQYGPDRKLRLEYLGDQHFNYKVVQTINTLFKYGDIVHVPDIKEGEPLSGWDVIRDNKMIGKYYSAENHLINSKRIIRRQKNN